jgi:hypothetical protein
MLYQRESADLAIAYLDSLLAVRCPSQEGIRAVEPEREL